ncbi:hypothetical protein SIM22_04235 [Bacillus cereus group sp. BfR-BA-01363]|uniref:hypothetical protein n=1 Tax=Bacillus cereus group sp. BfR-BA-01363 TaxID=3094882 RepID=UPI0029C18C43|nr:hypothetical protein [Bacillus cereus group sp. BfR-BA-01363]MDX5853337.1 hypothetical protein [Bacillus cereus group sp. BfR-BA-01363]
MFILLFIASILCLVVGVVWSFKEEEVMILFLGLLLAIICGLLGYNDFREDSRQTAIANKLDIPKSQIEFKDEKGDIIAITKDNTYKFTFKSISADIIKYEVTKENNEKDSVKDNDDKTNESKTSDTETVRKLVSEKLQLKIDEVVITKDKGNLYTAITSSGKYVVETEESATTIKAMVKQS